MKSIYKAILIGTLAGLSTGCATYFGHDDFSCSGIPEKAGCISARDAYHMAAYDKDDTFGFNDQKPRNGRLLKKKNEYDIEEDEVIVKTHIDEYVLPVMPNKPKPIRTPAKVMRMLLAPYEDKTGDLIVSSYMYSEIESRKWLYQNLTTESYQQLQLVKKGSSFEKEAIEEDHKPNISGIMEKAKSILPAR